MVSVQDPSVDVREPPPPPRDRAPAGRLVVGARCHHGRHDRRRDRGDPDAAPSEPFVHQHDDDGWRHGRAHRDAQVHGDDAQPRAPHRLGPGLVRRLPALHLLFHAARLLHRRRRLGHPLRRGVQAGHDLGVGAAADHGVGVRAVLPACARRSRPCWPRRRCRSSSTTRTRSTAATSSRRWRGSTPSRSAWRWRCWFLGLFAAAVREGRHRAWAAVVLAACILSHIVPGLYALGGAAVLTVIELLPARWGIGDSRLRLWRERSRRCPARPRTRTLWRAGSTVGIGLAPLRRSGSSRSGSSAPTPPRWGT